MLALHVGNRLSSSLLVFVQLLQLMTELLHFETFLCDARILGADCLLEISQFIIKACQLRTFLFQLRLGKIVSILSMC